MREIEVCDYRYDEGLRSRVEKQVMPTITTRGGGGVIRNTYGNRKISTN